MRFLILLLLPLLFVSCETVPVGHVGVFVKKPFLLGSNGVDSNYAEAGRHYFAFWSTTLETYNVQPHSLTEKFDDLITKDNMPVDFAAYIQVQLIPERVPELHSKFGKKWYKSNLERQFQEMVRNHAKKYEAFSLMSSPTVSDEMSRSIEKEVVEFVKSINLPIIVKNVSIGKVNPPDEVIKQVIETAAQEQKQKTEHQRANAELSRAKAEKNKALADREYQKTFNMTTKEYLVLRSLEIELEKIKMVREKQNVSIIMGSAMPTIDVRGQANN